MRNVTILSAIVAVAISGNAFGQAAGPVLPSDNFYKFESRFEQTYFTRWSTYAFQSETLRMMAPNALTKCINFAPQATQVLVMRLRSETDQFTRLEVIEGLTEVCRYNKVDDSGQRALLDCFKDPKETQVIKNAIVLSLVQLHDFRILPVLYNDLNGSDQQQANALRWLPEFQNEQVNQHLLNYFCNCHSTRRGNLKLAIAALGRAKYKPSLNNLLALMEERRDGQQNWTEIIAACDSIEPQSGTRFRQLLLDEDAAIAKAKADGARMDADFENAMRTWRQRIAEEKQKRANKLAAAGGEAALKWYRADRNGFGKALAEKIAQIWAGNGCHISDGPFFQSVISNKNVGNDHTSVSRPAVVFDCSIGADSQVYTIMYIFNENEDANALDFAKFTGAPVKLFASSITDNGASTKEAILAIESAIGRDSKYYVDPNKNAPDIATMFPQPVRGANVIPVRQTHYVWQNQMVAQK